MPLRTHCCSKVLSRTKEDARFAWFKCWLCGAVYRVWLTMTPGV